MYGLVTLVTLLALSILLVAIRIFRHGRALRVRGVTVTAQCVNEGNPSNGTSFLRVRFPADGTEWEASVGPFRFPSARIGESLVIVYDPRDLGNV